MRPWPLRLFSSSTSHVVRVWTFFWKVWHDSSWKYHDISSRGVIGLALEDTNMCSMYGILLHISESSVCPRSGSRQDQPSNFIFPIPPEFGRDVSHATVPVEARVKPSLRGLGKQQVLSQSRAWKSPTVSCEGVLYFFQNPQILASRASTTCIW